MKTGIKVSDIMGRGVLTASPEDTVKSACELMVTHDLGGISVVEKGNLVGILTQGDVLAVIASGENPKTTKVKEVMRKNPILITPDADLIDAAKLMVEKKVKRLPVTSSGRLIGMLTQNDIVKVSPSVYELIYEKARVDESTFLETEREVTGECEECGNYSQYLHNINGTLMCQECYEETKEE